mmetsp:Transcript_35399/g.66021  ORF Transcript_35399/g.66021 Transcript_35399/m.66021 type:complete len:207 (-) Transcript_35399:976-1596(-)
MLSNLHLHRRHWPQKKQQQPKTPEMLNLMVSEISPAERLQSPQLLKKTQPLRLKVIEATCQMQTRRLQLLMQMLFKVAETVCQMLKRRFQMLVQILPKELVKKQMELVSELSSHKGLKRASTKLIENDKQLKQPKNKGEESRRPRSSSSSAMKLPRRSRPRCVGDSLSRLQRRQLPRSSGGRQLRRRSSGFIEATARVRTWQNKTD